MAPAGVTQQELESRLWAAANSLRGPVDPADFKATCREGANACPAFART